ncbi:MAG: NAD/NADP octopine/nopaline dehydrogenase family protein [Chloroflexi bacterium]|nr:NAD/NADP octopine/nopaline dehydrogenase family protein [Chloroflexota bacterium]
MATVAILGAGNGGFAAAADLSVREHRVVLWNRSAATIAPLVDGAPLSYDGVLGHGRVPLSLATTDLAAAVDGADMVLVCLPAYALAGVARALAPLLRPDLPVVLNPGGMLGSLAFITELRAAGCAGDAWVGETATLTYIARKTGPASVSVTHVARDVPFAALPATRTGRLVGLLSGVLPPLRPARDILDVGLASVNLVLHPPAMVLAAAWIERTGGDFAYYTDTATRSVARLMARLDGERLAVAHAWRRDTPPFLDIFAAIGSTSPEAAASGDFLRALVDSEPNRHIRAPASLEHRYMREDIPFGVVPLASLGRAAGLATPILDAIITICSTITGTDFRATGRTLESLGFAAPAIDDLLATLTGEVR